MKYFVTGTTSFIGGYMVRQLWQAGHDLGILGLHGDNPSGAWGISSEVKP